MTDTYNPSIPQASDNLSVSQGQMLNNFTQLNSQFGIDHIAFNNGGINGDGHHVQCTFDTSVTPTSPTGTASVLYPYNTSTNPPFLWFSNATTDWQITGPFNAAPTSGKAFIPGGIILQWSTQNIPTPVLGISTITFSSAFPNNCLNVQATLNGGTSLTPIALTGFNATTFSFTSGASAFKVTWLAIGY